MLKRTVCIIMVFLLFALAITGCNTGSTNSDSVDTQIDSEVTDLQLALLNNIMYKDALYGLQGKSIEGHNELIDDKFKNNISGGDTLVDQLKGYTLVDYKHGSFSGFKAAAFTKGNSLVVVYCGTEDGKDWIEDLNAGVIDFSNQDTQAKLFAKSIITKYKHSNLYITGYSMGGRLCYLGAEYAYDKALAGNLKKVRTFNGLGVKEFIDFTDSNLSNIHNLQTKLADKTYDYIVDGDEVSDNNSHYALKPQIGYMHIGTEFKVPCTNKIDTCPMKQHDLYSIIDFLLNNPAPAENTNSVKNLNSKPVLIISSEDHNLSGEFINVDGDTKVSTWNTFVSKYPQVANPLNQGREYFSKMHITLFFLKDAEGNIIDNKGFMNATGFGSDPVGWKDKFGEFDWMYTDTPETYEDDDFYILYEGECFSGLADCHIVNARIREYVTLGTYEQDGNESTGKEPIEWLVLTQDNEKMLVVSKYCLDYMRYPDDWTSNISWEKSSLRNNLNSDFIANTFLSEEQQNIVLSQNLNTASKDFYSTIDGNTTEDKVFLLSIDEVQKYLPASTSTESSKKAYGTDYLYRILQEHPAYGNAKNGDPVNWALRADIDTDRNPEKFGRVREIVVNDSQIQSMITTGALRDPDGPFSVVRPAMWISSTVPKHR